MNNTTEIQSVLVNALLTILIESNVSSLFGRCHLRWDFILIQVNMLSRRSKPT